MKELGYLELEVYAAESRARYLQRKYEMMQAAMNRRQPINTPEIEKKLNEKAEEFKKVYEEFRKKAKEAEESVRKRRRNAQNASDGLGKEGEKTQKAGPEDDEDKKKQLPPGEEGSPEGRNCGGKGRQPPEKALSQDREGDASGPASGSG